MTSTFSKPEDSNLESSNLHSVGEGMVDFERRSAFRKQVDLETRVVTLVSKKAVGSIPARAANLCQDGAYLLTERAPPEDSVVRISSGGALQLTGRVIRVDDLAGGEQSFAVKFDKFDVEIAVPEDVRLETQANWHLQTPWVLELRQINERAFDYYPALRKVFNFVSEHYSDPISLEKVAAVATMERTYFSSFFHAKVGITFSHWLQYLRVAQAVKLLEAGDYSVTEVAFYVGFNDLRTFERTFRKWSNLAPREFKSLASPC